MAYSRLLLMEDMALDKKRLFNPWLGDLTPTTLNMGMVEDYLLELNKKVVGLITKVKEAGCLFHFQVSTVAGTILEKMMLHL